MHFKMLHHFPLSSKGDEGLRGEAIKNKAIFLNSTAMCTRFFFLVKNENKEITILIFLTADKQIIRISIQDYSAFGRIAFRKFNTFVQKYQLYLFLSKFIIYKFTSHWLAIGSPDCGNGTI